MSAGDPADPTPAPQSARLPWPTVLTAFLLVIFFGWMTYQMFVVRIDQDDAHWARSLEIYTAIESFALAAAGVLLGTQIQAGRVAAAEELAKRKEIESDQQKQRAKKAEDDLGGYRLITGELRKTLGAPRGESGIETLKEMPAEDLRIREARSLLDHLP